MPTQNGCPQTRVPGHLLEVCKSWKKKFCKFLLGNVDMVHLQLLVLHFFSYKFMTFLRLVREKAELMKTTGEEESRPSSSDSAESASKEPSSTGCPAAQHSEETLGTSDPEASTANTSQNPADTIQSPPDKSDVTVSGSDTAASSCLGDTNTEAQTTQNPAASNCLGDTNAEAETTQKPAATAPDSPLNTDEVVTGSSVNTSIKEDSTSEPESSNAISTCPHRSEDASSSNPADETKSSPVQAAPESKHSLPKSHPVAMPMASSRIALSALASASKPLLGNILEGGEKFASNELHLLDTLRLGEEKEVGPDVPRGIMDGDLLEAREQKLKGTEAAGEVSTEDSLLTCTVLLLTHLFIASPNRLRILSVDQSESHVSSSPNSNLFILSYSPSSFSLSLSLSLSAFCFPLT